MYKIFSLLILLFSFNSLSEDNSFYDGYYSYPAIKGSDILFVSDYDLWLLESGNKFAKRITDLNSPIYSPIFSEDGNMIYFVGTKEGHQEIYSVNKHGGQVKRLTYYGATKLRIMNIEKDIIKFVSNHESIFKDSYAYQASINNIHNPEKVNIGVVVQYYTSNNKTVIQRFAGSQDYSYWKNYKGGAKGSIMLDDGSGKFTSLPEIDGNMIQPIIAGDKIYFLADYEGHGSLYSMNFDGSNIQKELSADEYYIRNLSTDGKNIIFSSGGDIYKFSIDTKKHEKLSFIFPSSKSKKMLSYENNKDFLEAYAPHPNNDMLLQVIRGGVYLSHYYNGSYVQIGDSKYRYKDVAWSDAGKDILAVSSRLLDDVIEIYNHSDLSLKMEVAKQGLGRVIQISPSHNSKDFIFKNHKGEIYLAQISKNSFKLEKIDDDIGKPSDINWSKDDMHVSYALKYSQNKTTQVKLYSIKDHNSNIVIEDAYYNASPVIDDSNKYIYFISNRNGFDPYVDKQSNYEMFFPYALKPQIITLNKDVFPPFIHLMQLGEKQKEDKKSVINIKNASDRILDFPFPLSFNALRIYSSGDKIWFLISQPSAKTDNFFDYKSKPGLSLQFYDASKNKLMSIADGIDDALLVKNGENFFIKVGAEYRIISSAPSAPQPPQFMQLSNISYSEETGWINNNINLSVDYASEYEKIYDEAWGMQRDYFYNPVLMKDIDWDKIYNKYKKLVKRASTRTELNDILYEMQGELKSSHAYVFGGDFKYTDDYLIGSLGCNFIYDDKYKAYRIKNVLKGDSWNVMENSPLLYPGMNIKEDDVIYSINNKKLSKDYHPNQALMNLDISKPVMLEISFANGSNKRFINTYVLNNDNDLRYRNWVNNNRNYVLSKTKNKVGYVHIPDMIHVGYVEFYKSYIQQFDKYEALIIDVRYNSGGYISSQIMNILSRKRIAEFTPKNQNLWDNYQYMAPPQKMVMLTNQYAGSDGDIVTYAFKSLGLGKVIGTRTWGGLIGIEIVHSLIDGGITTQPQYPFRSASGKYDIENYGVDPDIIVDIKPEDYKNGIDTQLDRAIKEVM